MVWNHGAPQWSADLPLLFGCVADPLGRRRVDAALRGHAETEWFESLASLRAALRTRARRVHVALVDVVDRTGASAQGFAREMSSVYPGIGVVAYRERSGRNDAEVCMLGAAGVHDILVAGLSDEGYAARSILLSASRRGAADLVMIDLAPLIPPRLVPFADTAVRHPDKGTVNEIAAHLNVHRQTINLWCRKAHFLKCEELLVWCRLLLTASLLDLTSRTLDSIALELDYASGTALRNQLKRYTGMTATDMRGAGMVSVLEVFKECVAERRARSAGQDELMAVAPFGFAPGGRRRLESGSTAFTPIP